MLAGACDTVAFIQPLLAPMCRKTVDCGPTPNALIMKFAVNLFMIRMVTGLAEAMHFAQSYCGDLARLVTVLDASPIESSTVRREVEAAGFKFDSESSILANPADPRSAKVFDATIRGHTDQFILKFRKPKS